MKPRLIKLLAALLLVLLCRAGSQARKPVFFDVNPALFDNGFTYLIFPFNPAFMKAQHIRRLWYRIDRKGYGAGKHTYEFNRAGNLVKDYYEATDPKDGHITIELQEERIYNAATGLLDTVIGFDSRPRLTKVSCYRYDGQGRVEKVLNFGFSEIQQASALTPPPGAGPGIPYFDTDADKDKEYYSTSCIRGRPVDTAALRKMEKTNDFNSVRYRYYSQGGFDMEEETTFYDFSKKYGKSDSCNKKTYYYRRDGRVLTKAHQFNCTGNTDPSEYYDYTADGSLDSIRSSWSTKKEAFLYDTRHNLVSMVNMKDGKNISRLEMVYDKNGLLQKLIRGSDNGRHADYFMDNELMFDYEYY